MAGLVLCSLLVTKDWNPLTSCFARRDGDVGLAEDESDVYMREWTGEGAQLSVANDFRAGACVGGADGGA